jgi:sulfur-carrier protein adenylyltransferase/sulfurtransferase
MPPDYSRQMLLEEVGSAGQAALARSRVLIVGAGGLGSPVLQYLAGAGVGHIGLIDADRLEASNLHRQPLFALADVGRPKAELARDAVARLNPDVRVEVRAERFEAGNALELVGAHDIVVDCSDNFRTKFLINDAAVLARRPAVFASVYQYEGQIQVYKPQASHACLRCLWPEATADGVVGNCAEAGVLGPVPGAFGAMQALVTLKILLEIAGQLDGEILLMDFMNFTSLKLKAGRRPECLAPGCSLVRGLEPAATDLEVSLPSLEAAAERRLEIIDVRTPEEFALRSTPGRLIPVATLLADPQALAADGQYLLVCASGKRSLGAARELRRRGVRAFSLAGGLQALRS